MARAFYASRISENLSKTPEGFLLARGVVIARTGWQQYSVRELPRERLEQLGIDISDWSKTINVYRDEKDVFDPTTIASFEGKTICDDHPPGFVDTNNFSKYACGHTQNVRRGPEALESGDWPLLGDLLITVQSLIDKIENKNKREISCGYEYDLEQVGDRIQQTAILGNHVAVVLKGRAGEEARIHDHATEIDLKVPADIQQHLEAESSKTQKEKVKVKITDRLKHVFGLGLKQMATDASPEEMAEAAGEYQRLTGRAHDSEESEEEKKKREEMAKDAVRASDKLAADKAAADKLAADKKAADEAAEEERKKKEAEGKDEVEAHRVATKIGDHRCQDCKGADAKCHDCRMHDSLDKMLEAKHEGEGDDADMDELKELVGKHEAEGAEEGAEHDAAEGEESEVIEPVGEEETAGAMANDSAAALLVVIEKSPERRMLQRAFDAAPLEKEFEFLKAIKPAIAKCRDKNVRRAFDAQLRRFTRTSKAANGSYSSVAGAGRARDAARIKAGERETNTDPASKDYSKIQEVYNKARNGQS